MQNQPLVLAPWDAYPMPGLEIPNDFYWVLERPTPLAGMRYPRGDPWRQLWDAGFRHVVNVAEEEAGYDPAPLGVLYVARMHSLDVDVAREHRRVREAVATAKEKILEGDGVVVHCMGGWGRSGTVIGAILRSLGFEAVEVLQHLNALHRARGMDGWPEAEWQQKLVEAWPD